ncbi:Interferon-induced helicase C domain-containing protein 1, partial [Geodia barretti]
MFAESHVSVLFKAADIPELFGTMNFHWNYLSPPPLDHLVKKFDLDEVKPQMKAYKFHLQQFRMKTPLSMFCRTQKRKRLRPTGEFREMVADFEWPENVTLEVVEQFRQEYASHYNLRECAMMIAQVRPGSFIITWFIPESVVEMLKKEVPRAILKKYSATKLEIAGACVYRSRKPQEKVPVTPSTISGPASAASVPATGPALPGARPFAQQPKLVSVEDYLFVEQPSDDFFCPVTFGLLLHPYLTSCCGNHLSEEAASRIQREGGACPLCKKKDWSTMFNKHFQRQVNSLCMFCCHEDRGCGWQGELAAFHPHVNSCPMRDCPPMTELVKLPVYRETGASTISFGASSPRSIASGTDMKRMMDLRVDDLYEVQEAIWDTRPKWKNIGLGLLISPPDIEVINENNGNIDDKFHSMILKWLENGKNCTWAALCKALSARSVGHANLAARIMTSPATLQHEPLSNPEESKVAFSKELSLQNGIWLRGYQEELAGPGLQGENYIFVAPTGTGKTLVAGYIIMHHLNKMLKEGRRRKVAFVTPTRQLTFQQKTKLQEYIPGMRLVEITGASCRPMHPLVQGDEVDVIVCTAGKLRRELKTEAVEITDFSLIVADECHHAGRPSNYSDIMEFYIRSKLAKPASTLPPHFGGTPLPQIVGLTASPGAGRGKSNIVTVVEHQLSLCASMDATSGIVTVQRNAAELEKYRNAPRKYLEVGDERNPNDPFILYVNSAMETLEHYIGNNPCLARGSSGYDTWLQNEKEAAENREEDERKRISVLDRLSVYSQCLMTYSDFRHEDAVSVLEEVEEFRDQTGFEHFLFGVHMDLMEKLSSLPKIPNPLLEHMETILRDQFARCPQSKGIFFVQSIKHTRYVTNWIKSSPTLSPPSKLLISLATTV